YSIDTRRGSGRLRLLQRCDRGNCWRTAVRQTDSRDRLEVPASRVPGEPSRGEGDLPSPGRKLSIEARGQFMGRTPSTIELESLTVSYPPGVGQSCATRCSGSRRQKAVSTPLTTSSADDRGIPRDVRPAPTGRRGGG